MYGYLSDALCDPAMSFSDRILHVFTGYAFTLQWKQRRGKLLVACPFLHDFLFQLFSLTLIPVFENSLNAAMTKGEAEKKFMSHQLACDIEIDAHSLLLLTLRARKLENSGRPLRLDIRALGSLFCELMFSSMRTFDRQTMEFSVADALRTIEELHFRGFSK